MSTVTFAKQGAAPTPPAVGEVTLYVASDGTLFAEDEGGIVTPVGGTGANKAVRNESGATLLKGKAVYASGLSSGMTLVALADKDDPAKRPAIGIVKEDIPNNSNGELAIISTVAGLDTSAFALTDQLVLGNAGALIRPPPDNSPFTGEVQNLAVVSRVHATLGEITVIVDGLNPVTADQIFALAGTDGAPGPTNKYVTDSDPRLSGVAFDPRDMVLFDHWVSGNFDTDESSMMGWRVSATGTGNAQQFISEVGHPGILRQNPGTTAAGRSALFLGGQTSLANFALGATQNTVFKEWLLRVNAAGLLAANNERCVAGFGDAWDVAGGTEQVNGVYIEFNPTVSANWLLRTAAAGISSSVDTGVAVVANNWYRIEVRITYPGGVPTATIYINGVASGSLTTNFPSAVLGIGIRADGQAGAGFFFDSDYVMVRQITNKET